MKFQSLVDYILEGKEGSDIAKLSNDLMNKDQKFKNPTQRVNWQRSTVQPFIKKNIERILADKEKNGDSPHAPYATWVLVQHMDADPTYQAWFLNQLENAIPQFHKLKFLQDRVMVNQIILNLYKKNKVKYDTANPNYAKYGPITSCIRDTKLFPTDGQEVTSPKAAFNQIVEADNNPLFVDALKQAYEEGVTTQPSYKG